MYILVSTFYANRVVGGWEATVQNDKIDHGVKTILTVPFFLAICSTPSQNLCLCRVSKTPAFHTTAAVN